LRNITLYKFPILLCSILFCSILLNYSILFNLQSRKTRTYSAQQGCHL